MLINEILNEMQGNGAFTRIAPKTLDMIARNAEYQRELAAHNKANKPSKEKDNSNDPLISLGYAGTTRLSNIDHWRENKDKQFIFDKSKGLYTLGMTDQMKQELFDDPNWQQAVIDLWDAMLVSQSGPGSGALAKRDVLNNRILTSRELNAVVMKHRQRHNIDNKGRRLPPR